MANSGWVAVVLTFLGAVGLLLDQIPGLAEKTIRAIHSVRQVVNELTRRQN